jgi:hypothetical protein
MLGGGYMYRAGDAGTTPGQGVVEEHKVFSTQICFPGTQIYTCVLLGRIQHSSLGGGYMYNVFL